MKLATRPRWIIVRPRTLVSLAALFFAACGSPTWIETRVESSPPSQDASTASVSTGLSVAVTPEETVVSSGTTTKLEAVVAGPTGRRLPVSPEWSTGDPSVATVDAEGRVTGVSVGSTEVRAIFARSEASARIIVIPASVPAEGLVGWYPFEGTTQDRSGNDNHYVNEGGVFTADRLGTPSAAVSFPAHTDQLSRDWPDFPSSSFTVSLWVKMEGQFDDNAFSYFEWGDEYTMSSGDDGITIGLDANWTRRGCASVENGYVMYLYQGEGTVAWESDGCTDYQVFAAWNHVAVTAKDGTATVYWNGEILGTLTHSVPMSTVGTMSWIGNQDNNTNPLPTRFVDDLGVWNRVLSPEEILYLASH